MSTPRTTDRKEPEAPRQAAPPKGSRRAALMERARALLQRRRSARAKRRLRTLVDVLTALALIGGTLGVLYVASDGAWPPLLVVESHSMMHLTQDTPYGRYGTIDVGDVLLVRNLDEEDRIRTWADGQSHTYGRPGDVIAFAQDGDRSNTTIIHRAMAYVEVVLHENLSRSYRVHWMDGKVLEFGHAGIYLPELGFDERFGFSRVAGYQPSYSGYITKGDNPQSNPAADQAIGISSIVQPTWIEGRVHGEVPWIGLAKLALQLEQTNPYVNGWQRVGNGFAPVELWTCFFVVLALLVLVPLAWDTYRLLRERRRDRQVRDEEEAEMARRREAQRLALEDERRRRAEERARRGPVEFQPVD